MDTRFIFLSVLFFLLGIYFNSYFACVPPEVSAKAPCVDIRIGDDLGKICIPIVRDASVRE